MKLVTHSVLDFYPLKPSPVTFRHPSEQRRRRMAGSIHGRIGDESLPTFGECISQTLSSLCRRCPHFPGSNEYPYLHTAVCGSLPFFFCHQLDGYHPQEDTYGILRDRAKRLGYSKSFPTVHRNYLTQVRCHYYGCRPDRGCMQ